MRDVFVQKLDHSGNFLWTKNFGGSSIDVTYDLALDSLSNIYVSDHFSDTVDFDPGTGVYNQSSSTIQPDAFIHKLDSAGNFQWVNTMGSVSYDYGYSVTIGENGGLYFGSSLSIGGRLGIIQKLGSSGNVIWADSLIRSISPYGLHVDNQENIYSTGEFKNTTDFDPDTGGYNITPGIWGDVFVLNNKELCSFY